MKAFVVVAALGTMAATPASSTVSSNGPQRWREMAPPVGSADIYRDPFGVPHINAVREEDGFFALGYAVAEDNLEDVLRQVVLARGEGARFFGPSFVAVDQLHALFEISTKAREGYARSQPGLRRNLQAYAEGVRRYLADHPAERPAWASGIDARPEDFVAFSHFFVLLYPVNAVQGMGDCRRGGVELPSTLALFESLIRTGGPANASTAWAVSPWRTHDGVAIHLADPHSRLDISSPEFRMHTDGFEMAGFTTSMMVTGHTRRVAWGTTFGSSDVADCYKVTVNDTDSSRYRAWGEERTFERREVAIAVKDEAPRTVVLEYVTLNGRRSPVLARKDGLAFVLATPYLDRAEGSLADLYAISRAQDLQGMKSALSSQGLFPVGLTVADANGSIGYFRVGRTPVRDPSIDWDRPVSADDPATRWRGLHPFGELVNSIDPKQGYVRETNLSASSMWGGDNQFAPPQYPAYILGDNEFNQSRLSIARGQRLDEVLSRTLDMDEVSARGLASDTTLPFARIWISALANAMGTTSAVAETMSADEREIAGRILTFDGHAEQTSIRALAYNTWHEGVASAAGSETDRLVNEVHRGARLAPSDAALLIEGVRRAARNLRASGLWQARFGDVFRIGRGGETYPVSGCATPFENPLRIFLCAGQPGEPRLAMAGQKSIMLTIFSNPVRSWSYSSFGQTWRNDPQAPHYNDQSILASEGRLKPTYFEYDELIDVAQSKLRLARRPR